MAEANGDGGGEEGREEGGCADKEVSKQSLDIGIFYMN